MTINYDIWLAPFAGKLIGKRVAVFGATGGIGGELCRYILKLGGTLITVDRNPEKAAVLQQKLALEFPDAAPIRLTADLEDIYSVENVCKELMRVGVDIVIHNAGAYHIPRHTCDTGFDNVFQINFVSPYYATAKLADYLSARGGRVVAVGSIAHRYSKIDAGDIDFSTRRKSSLVYGNAKRYLMGAFAELIARYPKISFAVTHPGITLTNITAHYPKWIFALIKYPMKVLFMSPKEAAISIVLGMFEKTAEDEWIGPQWFDVWGKPAKLKQNAISETERAHIAQVCAEIERRWVL